MKRFWSFLFVGTLGFLVDAAITLSLVNIVNFPALAARLPAFILATVVTYELNRRYTFPGKHGSRVRGWSMYVLATAFGATLNYGIYSWAIFQLGETEWVILLGVAAGSLMGLLSNYTLSRLVVFRRAMHSSVSRH